MINARAVKRLETKLKRQSQSCKVFEIKLDKSKLSEKALHHINIRIESLALCCDAVVVVESCYSYST